MRKTFLPFSTPSIDENEISAVTQVLRSGWITTGPKNAKFEADFCKYTGSKNAVALASATAGMHLLMKAMNIGIGDEVISPSMTWVSTINLISLCGAKPVFVDVDIDTLMLTAHAIEKAITPRTKLIIPVHFAGSAVDMDAINQISKKYKIPIVQDAAHAIGTQYKGSRIGEHGTSIFSFHPIKNITTGEGGMFCSDDDELIEKIRRLKFHGLGVDAYDRTTHGRSPQAEVLEPGYKYNMSDISAVLGIKQLEKLNTFNKKRTYLASIYSKAFEEIDEIIPLKNPEYSFKHAWHLFIVRLDIQKLKISRDDFMAKLKEKNIGTGIHFRAVHTQKYYLDKLKLNGTLPNTEWNSDRIFSLPLCPAMEENDVDDVVEAIKDSLRI